MKSLYQATLEQFTGTQELKEGDYVVCPMYPNDAIKLCECEYNAYFLEYILTGMRLRLDSSGRYFEEDQFPLFLKCSPPKKKVEMVFEVYINSFDFVKLESKDKSVRISAGKDESYDIKAKLIVEVEE